MTDEIIAIEEAEIKLLTDAIRIRYGYDFTQYAKASLKRRIKKGLEDAGKKHISELIPMILHEPDFFSTFFLNLSINVTEMFRNPSFYNGFRKELIPYLKTYPHIKIWAAGCSTGEEAYSIAIMLEEEKLYDKCLIYATDFNDSVINAAKDGIYSLKYLKKYTANYHAAGGQTSLSDYFHSDDDNIIIKRELKKNIVFTNHNLSTDESFGEMNVILCRNVLIYFSLELQNRVLELFDRSLLYKGFLCLGRSESLSGSAIYPDYQIIDTTEKIYQKSRSTVRGGSEWKQL